MSVGFRPTDEDARIIETLKHEGESTTDVIRRALRVAERDAWEQQARADMHRLRSEDLSAEPPAWEFDEAGNIHVIGTPVTVPRRNEESTR